jgi:pimeloyl-ACP methyl ester carboxylesterase
MGEQNEKPALVFLHYFGGSSQSWKWVAQLLSDRYQCILIDQPGFGTEPALATPSIQSFAGHIAEQLQSLNITGYTLIGHSMGGKIAMQMAVDDQRAEFDRVKRLILIAPSPPSTERMPKEEQLRMLIHPDREQAETTVKNGTIKSLAAEQHDLAVYTQMIVEETTWRWWIKEGINHSIADAVRELQIPITLIASKDDPAVTYQMTTEDAIPNLPLHTKMISTEGIGHLFSLEDADWTAAQISAIESTV